MIDRKRTIGDLLAHGSREELLELNNVLVETVRSRRKEEAAEKRFSFRPGEIAVLTNIRPKHLVGKKVKIIEILKTRAQVRIEGEIVPVRVPLTCLEKTEDQTIEDPATQPIIRKVDPPRRPRR